MSIFIREFEIDRDMASEEAKQFGLHGDAHHAFVAAKTAILSLATVCQRLLPTTVIKMPDNVDVFRWPTTPDESHQWAITEIYNQRVSWWGFDLLAQKLEPTLTRASMNLKLSAIQIDGATFNESMSAIGYVVHWTQRYLENFAEKHAEDCASVNADSHHREKFIYRSWGFRLKLATLLGDTRCNYLPRLTRELIASSSLDADAAPVAAVELPKSRLGDSHRAAATFIRANHACAHKQVATTIGVEEATFRNHVWPELKRVGFSGGKGGRGCFPPL